VLRSALLAIIVSIVVATPVCAQTGSDVIGYFSGKEVVVKIDMPGSQKGIDLRYNKPDPMNWKDYSSRIKQFGIAIHKGDTARVTTVVVKKDMIEFQLNGGGFGTFGDDTNTTVAAKSVANTDDPDKTAQLQRDLDRERARRQRQDDANQRAAQVASQIKAQQVMDQRLQGGSRFNLRWQGSIPPNQLTPDAVMARLSEYIDFGSLQAGGSAPATAQGAVAQPVASQAAPASPTAQLQRGMSLNDVAALLGQGKLLSESVGDNGLKTQVYEYQSGDRKAEVTFVEGTVVKFAITSQ